MGDKLISFKEGSALDRETVERWANQDPEIREAIEELEKLGANEKIRWEIEARREGIRRWLTGMKGSFTRGFTQGHEEGREEGREEGIQEGEWKTLKAVAQRMDERGSASREDIAEDLALTLEQLEELLSS